MPRPVFLVFVDNDTICSVFLKILSFLGDAILIDGQVAHKSEQSRKFKYWLNFLVSCIVIIILDTSPYSRQTCAVPIFESHNSIYCKENW